MTIDKKVDYNHCYSCGEYVNINDNDVESTVIISKYFDTRNFCGDMCFLNAKDSEIKRNYFNVKNENEFECSKCESNSYFLYYKKNQKYKDNLKCSYCLHNEMNY